MKVPSLVRGSRWSLTISLACVASLVLVPPSSAYAQSAGVVRGKVTADGSGTPLPDVQVYIVGSRRGGVTNEAGRFVIVGAPAGALTIRAQKIGYAPAQRSVTVVANDSATADFVLNATALSLDEVVVTGTPGATEKRVLGNTVSSVKAEDITQQVPVPSVSEMLQGRVAGINVMQRAGTVGTASNIRIRGASSLSANYNPVVYVDGIRINSGVQKSYDNTGSTVQATSALDAINPDDIESMEVIKGPAAATLYGADAASGVIQIITKKGRLGQQSLQWSAKAEMGNIDWALDRPKTYFFCTDAQIADATTYPECAKLGAGAPASARYLINDPLNAPNAVVDGSVRTLGASARGGGDRYSYFLSADRDEEKGIFVNNFFNRTSGRTNFQVSLNDAMDVAMNVGYARTGAQIPLADNSSNSILRNALRGRPSGPFPWAPQFRGLGPEQSNAYDNRTYTERYILGATLNYRPRSWFQNRLALGIDANDRTHRLFFPIDTTGKAPHGADYAPGWIGYIRATTHQWTVDYAGTATAQLRPTISSALSAGMQFNQSKLESYTSEGKGLVADQLNTVGAAATKNADQDLINQNSLGFYLQEQVGWRERLYVTGAVRVDNNSAFGDEIKLVTYPKASVAYVISDERFFRIPYVNQLKLRAAWGEAGNAPAPFSATRAYEPTVTTQGDVAVNQVRTSTYGNPNLKAETGSEIELGFDASLLNGRAGIEVTYYDKITKDALVTVPAPASTGFVGTYLSNLGEIKNAGLEIALNGTPISGRLFSWDTRLTFATNANKLVSFGADIDEIFFGEFANVQKHKAGYPLGGFWASDVQRDANGKPVLDANGKVIPQLATNHYVGPSLPTREISLTNTLNLPGNFRVYGYLDYKGGYYGWEALWSVRDRLDRNTFEVANPNADPVNVQVLQSGVTAPYINRADFVKLRELSLTYTVPQMVLRHVGVKGASVIVSGRNLAIWKLKNYRGLDPEVNFANQTSTNGQFFRTDYGSVPMLRRIVTSLNLTF